LVWINSHGSPTVFHLGKEDASTLDVPRTVPCAVVMVHSFSAADPDDPSTIAGRWLANGAFVYFGSMNEPFLQAFRTPRLVVDLLAEHLPMAAALRNTSIEAFSAPWRLEYLGDPLFRLKPRPLAGPRRAGSGPHRILPDETTANWPVITGSDPTPTDGSAEATLRLAVDEAFASASSPQTNPNDPAIADSISKLSAIDRDRLPAGSRRKSDSILADLLYHAKRRGELRSRIESIPPGERPPELGRWLDAIRSVDFAWLLSVDDFDRIVPAWTRIVGSDAPNDFQRQATARVGAQANDPDRRSEWAAALRAKIGDRPLAAGSDYLGAELTKVEAAIRLDQKITSGSTGSKK